MDTHFNKDRSLLTPVEPRPVVSRRWLMPMLIVAALFLVAYSALAYRVTLQRRTMETLADVRTIESAFHAAFRESASYAVRGCTEGDSIAACTLFGERTAEAVLLRAPDEYTLGASPKETEFSVRFSLPQRAGDLAKGAHILSEQGIE